MSRIWIIKDMRANRFTFQQIADLLEISKQRVHQIWRKEKNKQVKNSRGLDDFIRIQVMRRDNFTCRKCRYVGRWRDKKLAVHHIDKSGQTENPNNSLKNLMTLCVNCHGKAH